MMFSEARAFMRQGGEESAEVDNVSTMRRGMQAVRSALHRSLARKAVCDMWKCAAATHELKATEEERAQEAEEQKEEELRVQEVEEEVAEEPAVGSAEGAIDNFRELFSKLGSIDSEAPAMATVASTAIYVHNCSNLLRELRKRGYQNLRATKAIGSSTEQNREVMGRLIDVMRANAEGIQRALKAVQAFRNTQAPAVVETGHVPAPETKGKAFWFDAPQHDLSLLGILDEINTAIAHVDNAMHFEQDGSKRPPPRPERLPSDSSFPRRRASARHPSSQSDASAPDAPAGTGEGEAPREEAKGSEAAPRAAAEEVSESPKAAERRAASAWAALPHLLRQRRAERVESVGQRIFNLESLSRATTGLDAAPQEPPPDERPGEEDGPLQEAAASLEQFIVAAAAAPLAPLPAVADHAAAPAQEEPRAARRRERQPSAPIRGMGDLSCEEAALLDSLTGHRPGRAAPTPMAHRLRRCQDAAAAVGHQSFAEQAGGCGESAGLSGRFRRSTTERAAVATTPRPRARKLAPLDLPSLLGLEKPPSARQSVSVGRMLSVP